MKIEMKNPILYSTAPATILIAAAESLDESEALMRWVKPVLDAHARPSWACWLVDAADCATLRAAMFDHCLHAGKWRKVDGSAYMRHGDVCRLMAERAGLIFLVYPPLARELKRQLEGLASALIEVGTDTAEAAPFLSHVRDFAAAA
jgi:hypothetical protein